MIEIKITDKVRVQVQHVCRTYDGEELEDKLVALVREWFQSGFATGIDFRVKQKEQKLE